MGMADPTLDFRLLNEFQRDLPLCPAPFAVVAERLGVSEGVILRRLVSLRQDGKVARVGAVFAPKRIGASTLGALAVPPERLAAVAAMVTRFPEVNHNYEREHLYNLWFVLTAASESRLQAVLDAIAQRSGCPSLDLPLLREYHVDLGFPLDAQDTAVSSRSLQPPVAAQPQALDAFELQLVAVLQEGLPLCSRPFAVLAMRVGCSEEELLERVGRWCAVGIIKRLGVIVRHRELGYTANAMVVHDVPDAVVAEVGVRLGLEPAVSLCYQRPRVPPVWPYNLFCMVHGQIRADVEARVVELRSRLKLTSYAYAVLFSRTCYKQGGAHYV